MNEHGVHAVYLGQAPAFQAEWLDLLRELRRRHPHARLLVYKGPHLTLPPEADDVVDDEMPVSYSRRSLRGLLVGLRLTRHLRTLRLESIVIVHDAFSHRLAAGAAGARAAEFWGYQGRIHPIARTFPGAFAQASTRWPRRQLYALYVLARAYLTRVHPNRG